MSKRANPALIGAFVVGAIALAVLAILVLAGGELFTEKRRHVMFFEGSVQGLQVGAPVVYRGVKVGSVVDIQLTLEEQGLTFQIPVVMEVDPRTIRTPAGEPVVAVRGAMQDLVKRGLKARLKSQSLLTGQLYVDLDFYPDKPARLVSKDPKVSEIPTIPTPIEELTRKFAEFPIEKLLSELLSITTSINKLVSSPELANSTRNLDQTLQNLSALTRKLDSETGSLSRSAQATLGDARKALASVQATLGQMNVAVQRIGTLASNDSELVKSLTNAANQMANAAQTVQEVANEDAEIAHNLVDALHETSRTARELRSLARTIDNQPESLLRGRKVSEGR